MDFYMYVFLFKIERQILIAFRGDNVRRGQTNELSQKIIIKMENFVTTSNVVLFCLLPLF